jgi:tetratricopeptide (TPR) repeat protein
MFLPMALGAYDQARPLDHDGLFHLSLLNRVAGNLDEALANAEEVLADDPDHVLALMAAAEAEVEIGDRDAAAGYYGHILEVIDAQIARGLPEYEAHRTIMDAARSDAEAFLGG